LIELNRFVQTGPADGNFKAKRGCANSVSGETLGKAHNRHRMDAGGLAGVWGVLAHPVGLRRGRSSIMSGFNISRRTMLAGSAMLLASTAMPDIGWAQTPKKGGRLVLAADSEPRNLNPAIVASNGVFFISSKIVETLAEASFDGKDGLAPRLALSWEGAADGLSVTFKLRDGVKWHDGKPFTSADVAFSALQIWKPLCSNSPSRHRSS
jgi:hypothetical protein